MISANIAVAHNENDHTMKAISELFSSDEE